MNSPAETGSDEFEDIAGSTSLGAFMKAPDRALLDKDIAKGLRVIDRILAASDEEIGSRSFLIDALLEFGIPVMDSWIFDPWRDKMNRSGFGALQFPSEFIDFLRTTMSLGIRSAVEIGVYRGGTSYFMAAVLQRVNPEFTLTLVDPVDYLIAFDQFSSRLRLEKRIPSTSDDHIGEIYDLVFIDGDHSFAGAMRDFDNLGIYAAKALAFHDIHAREFDNLEGGTVRAWGEIKRTLLRTHAVHEFAHSVERSLGIGLALRSEEATPEALSNLQSLRRSIADGMTLQPARPTLAMDPHGRALEDLDPLASTSSSCGENSDPFKTLGNIHPMTEDSNVAPENIWENWYDGTNFTTDWSSRAFPRWIEKLSDLRDKQLEILEVGCWEGRGTIFFLNFFKDSRVTALDLFMFGNEGLFDSNVIKNYGHRVRKVAARSSFALDRLATREKRAFDLIYLDGSHDTDDVMIDSLLAWRLLKVGGTLIWDDYKLISAMPGCFNQYQDPKPAIDIFLQWKAGEYEMIDSDYQVIVRKTRAHYEMPYTLMDPLMDPRALMGD